MENTVLNTVRKYENVLLYIGFLVVAGFLAASRGCGQEFFTILLYPIMIPLLLSIGMLIFCAIRGANGRILLVVQIMLTLAALMRAVFWTSYPSLFGESSLTILDYLLVQIVILVVMLGYPVKTSLRDSRVYEILASRKFTWFMLFLIAALYGLLFLFGSSYGGAKSWLTVGGFSIQLTEFIKLLFVICLAAMMKRNEKTPFVIVFYLLNAILMGGALSEFGTVMVMTFVFFIFLFIYPQKKGVYYILGVAVFVLLILGVVVLRICSNEYEYALKNSDSRVFAAKFAGTLYDYAMSTPEDVVTMDILGEMIDKSLGEMKPDKQAEFGRAFHSISQQISDGKLRLSDFGEAHDSDVLEQVADIIDKKTEDGVGPETAKALTEAIQKYPAVTSLARLCEESGFRDAYITQFCRNDFYTTGMLYQSAPSGFWHNAFRKLMWPYSKFIERVVLPNKGWSEQFGFSSEVPYQLAAAQSAMQVGGLTGAEKHEFYYVPVMESDMIYSEMVSIYGFGMGFFVILLYMILFREGMKEAIALRGKPFHRGLAIGITLTIFIQALIIIAGNLNLFPLTGITLPFIADGTISMLVFAVMIGILIAVSYVPIVEDDELEETKKSRKKKLFGLPGRARSAVKGVTEKRKPSRKRGEEPAGTSPAEPGTEKEPVNTGKEEDASTGDKKNGGKDDGKPKEGKPGKSKKEEKPADNDEPGTIYKW